MPARAGGIEALAAALERYTDVLKPVQRQVVLPAADDRVGEQAGAGEAALDGQLHRRRLQDLRLGQPVALPRHELRLVQPHHHQGGRPPLRRLHHVLADALEGVQPRLLVRISAHRDRQDRSIVITRIGPS